MYHLAAVNTVSYNCQHEKSQKGNRNILILSQTNKTHKNIPNILARHTRGDNDIIPSTVGARTAAVLEVNYTAAALKRIFTYTCKLLCAELHTSRNTCFVTNFGKTIFRFPYSNTYFIHIYAYLQ